MEIYRGTPVVVNHEGTNRTGRVIRHKVRRKRKVDVPLLDYLEERDDGKTE